MAGQGRTEGVSPTLVIAVALGALAVVAVAVVGWYAYQLTDMARKLPQADADLEVVDAESITDFVPANARLTSSESHPAIRAVFGNTESDSVRVRTFTTDDVGATMAAFVEPAISDGWQLETVACRRVLNTSEMIYSKKAPRHDGTMATMRLKVSYDPLGERVVAVTSVPHQSVVTPPVRPVGELLYSGVSRTDPGCLRDRREPSSAVPPPAPWTSGQTCAVIAAAWPNATVEPTSSEYCIVRDGYSLNIRAVGTTDPYDFEDDRLSTAGGESMFATIDGGFWVVRPDGVALYAASPNSTLEGVPPEEELLRAAALLAEAPGPT